MKNENSHQPSAVSLQLTWFVWAAVPALRREAGTPASWTHSKLKAEG